MESFDSILGLNSHILSESATSNGSTTRVVSLLGDFAEKLSSSSPYAVSKKNFAFAGAKTSVDEFKGIMV